MASDLQFPLIKSLETDDRVIHIAPWKLYEEYPNDLCNHLYGRENRVVGDKYLTMMMPSHNPDLQLSGKLDKFCNMWVITCNTVEDIDDVLEKLETQFCLLYVLLIERRAFSDSIEIPMVLFVNNKSRGIELLKDKLKKVRGSSNDDRSKQFSFEVDYGPTVEKWALNVLNRDFICVGGRICVTNGASFNHVLDWNNILTCLPCIPCCLLAGSIYRAGRKIRYLESIHTPDDDVILSGATNDKPDDQRITLLKLLKWTEEKQKQGPVNNSKLSKVDKQAKEAFAGTRLDLEMIDEGAEEEGVQIELSTFKTQSETTSTKLGDIDELPEVDTDADLLASSNIIHFLARGQRSVLNLTRSDNKIDTTRKRGTANSPAKVTGSKNTKNKSKVLEVEPVTQQSTV
ncbi:uncharacterized protein LOC126830202 [Patella vulgata]|uniref:uncharacterized protein LOC126830202 n=1 Tax=Patella vulgata TaxID=6465 RepID=UPI00217FE0F9|nr:uncharacterized protein LOC126830202 [Patella vulgata]